MPNYVWVDIEMVTKWHLVAHLSTSFHILFNNVEAIDNQSRLCSISGTLNSKVSIMGQTFEASKAIINWLANAIIIQLDMSGCCQPGLNMCVLVIVVVNIQVKCWYCRIN